MPRCYSTDIWHETVNRWARKKASKPGGRERAQEGVRGHQETSVKWCRLRIFSADPYEWDLTKARPRNTAEVESDKCQEIVSENPAEPRDSCVGKRLRAYSLHSHLHSGATQPRRTLCMLWGPLWDLRCWGGGGGGGGPSETERWAYIHVYSPVYWLTTIKKLS